MNAVGLLGIMPTLHTNNEMLGCVDDTQKEWLFLLQQYTDIMQHHTTVFRVGRVTSETDLALLVPLHSSRSARAGHNCTHIAVHTLNEDYTYHTHVLHVVCNCTHFTPFTWTN